VQKHRIKALDGDGNALRQKPRLSVPPLTSEIHRPKSYRKEVADSLIGPSVSTAIDWKSLWVCEVAYFASLRYVTISATQPGPCTARRVSRGADNCHVPRQGPAAFKRNQRDTIYGLLPSWRTKPTGSSATGTPAAAKARATRSFSMWCLDNLPGACLQTRLCRPRASTGEPHRQRCGTHKSSPRRKPTATLTASSSSLRPQDAIGKANSQSPLWRAVAAKKEASWRGLSRQDWTWVWLLFWCNILEGREPRDVWLAKLRLDFGDDPNHNAYPGTFEGNFYQCRIVTQDEFCWWLEKMSTNSCECFGGGMSHYSNKQ